VIFPWGCAIVFDVNALPPLLSTLQPVLKPPRQVWQPWLFSRLLIWVTLGLIAPQLGVFGSARDLGWDVFLLGDGDWYRRIATQGYSMQWLAGLAFFPLFPMLCSSLMVLFGISFVIAGLLINNLSFLVGLTILHHWLSDRWHPELAKWSIAVFCWLPLSLFFGIADSDGLFLLLNVLTLYWFDQRFYRGAAIVGALTTATRSMGLSLVPTLMGTAWQQRRSNAAYWIGGICLVGFIGYGFFCAAKFGNLAAFDLALQTMPDRPMRLLDFGGWGTTLRAGIVGPIDVTTGKIKSIGYPIQFCTIEILAFLLWRFQDWVKDTVRPWLAVGLVLWFWALWPVGFLRTLVVVGGLYLFWRERKALDALLRNHTFWSLLWLIFSLNPVTPERGMMAVVGMPICLGMWLVEQPLWRLPMLVGFGVMLMGMGLYWVQGIG
jgi:hypothetical protein